ncbi:hypothetical protein [Catenuloplanes atrovinosus]|uniref:Uncharacterized protein n=1 Tax=Catenuloplanes atrovinosus TaxID=137266 RepID=A0AAE4CC53_9ACTN|nr:hypothetical protein [Catenuloplanes atrovinosus]MDR7277619.1 hypothetical protein [Catenuloplanes atrovinosus]
MVDRGGLAGRRPIRRSVGDAELEIFANLTEAHARTARRLRAMRRHRAVRAGAVVVQDLQIPVDGRPPAVGAVFVSACTQLWLWDDLEAARARRLPARVLRVRAGRIDSIAGRAAIAGVVAAVRRPPEPARAAAGMFRTTLLDGYTIRWIPGDGTIMSIPAPGQLRAGPPAPRRWQHRAAARRPARTGRARHAPRRPAGT